jgi:cation transport ATPase
MPAEKRIGAALYAGTVNQNGALEARVERLGRNTSFRRIIEAVESAERSRAPVERLAGYRVYFALGAAVLTFLITRNVVAAISVIIVTGTCGVAAGTVPSEPAAEKQGVPDEVGGTKGRAELIRSRKSIA